MNDVVKMIRQHLILNADRKTRVSGRKFFKEEVKLYGVKTEVARRIGQQYFKAVHSRGKAEVFSLCGRLWRSGYMEESFIACNWSYYLRKDYEEKDLMIFESWLAHYVGNWASCDTLCNHTIGSFLELYPHCLDVLKKWARSKNRWMRRAAAVSLIVPAKKGRFLRNIFEIADILLLDDDDLVQKGYGWMLKAAGQAHEKQVFDYVLKHKARMPRTALRYAIEKMPKELKQKAMKSE